MDRCDVPAPSLLRSGRCAALFVAVSAQWTILAPAGRSPDEPAHVDLVLWLADGGSYPDYDELSSSRATVDLAFSRSTIGGERRLTPEGSAAVGGP